MPWREIQRHNFTRIDKLLDFLEMSDPLRAQIWQKPRFPLNLPLRLAHKITKNTLNDPILRQFLPLNEEMTQTPGFMTDPVADATFRKGNKLLVKYQGRALLSTTGACAMNCRFCFRQNFDYATETKGFKEELSLIAQDPSLSEIILSGGDPLSLSNETLKELIDQLEKIPHLKLLRFHSRFPIGIPERIDAGFLNMLKNTRLQPIFIIHTNHPRELDDDIFAALKKLQCLNIPLLSQTVLLQEVNDNEETLKMLMLQLVHHGVMPYYLHQLDRVQGTAHFEVSQEKGKSLMETLLASLPGYAVPRYVREIPGSTNKTPL
jgi:EF-P beta-lysylation protein EpmB